MQEIEYIKSSFAVKTFPIIAGNTIKEGHVCIHLDTLLKDTNIVRLLMQTFDKERNETGNIQMLLTQATVKEISKQLFATTFDSDFRIMFGSEIEDIT